MSNKEIMELTLVEFKKLTGIKVDYVRQRGNGSWLWFGTSDNMGMGMYIGVEGYVDASNTLNAMMNGYKLAKTLTF